MAGIARPLLPVREDLGGLELIRPPPVPFIGRPALAPAMGKTKRHPSIKAVTLPKDVGHDHPGHALSPQPTHQLLSLLLVTAQLDHGPTFVNSKKDPSALLPLAGRYWLGTTRPSQHKRSLPGGDIPPPQIATAQGRP